MADLSIRRGEPREPGLARAWDPHRTWDPFRALDPLRMIRDIISGELLAGLPRPTGEMFAPDIEVKETKDAFQIRADLPGVKEDDLEITITGNRLSVTGKREEEKREESDRYFAYERSYGSFSRSLTLPEGADMDDVRADLHHGVLEITVPKRSEVQPRRVQLGGRQGEQKPAGAKEPGKKAA